MAVFSMVRTTSETLSANKVLTHDFSSVCFFHRSFTPSLIPFNSGITSTTSKYSALTFLHNTHEPDIMYLPLKKKKTTSVMNSEI